MQSPPSMCSHARTHIHTKEAEREAAHRYSFMLLLFRKKRKGAKIIASLTQNSFNRLTQRANYAVSPRACVSGHSTCQHGCTLSTPPPRALVSFLFSVRLSRRRRKGKRMRDGESRQRKCRSTTTNSKRLAQNSPRVAASAESKLAVLCRSVLRVVVAVIAASAPA